MRYEKIIEYANSKSLVVSEAPNSGLKMNYEVGGMYTLIYLSNQKILRKHGLQDIFIM